MRSSGQEEAARTVVPEARPFAAWFALAVAFAVVHTVLALINVYDTQHLPFGDVIHVYRFWMQYAQDNGVLVGIDTSWVYPVGALLPMGFAYLLGPDHYGVLWLVLVTALDAAAIVVLARRRRAAAWWWLAFLAALGPVALARIDAVTAPLAILAAVWLIERPAVAGALLTLAAWIKVWPAAMVGAALIALRSWLQVAIGALLVTAGVLLAALALGGGAGVFGFVFEQTGRGLQVEAPVSAWWLWAAMLGLDGSVYYDTDILTYQIAGPGAEAVAAIMTPVLAVVVGVIVALGLLARRRDADSVQLVGELSLALVLALIVVNKVGSPQFQGWLAAPVILLMLHTGMRAVSARALAVLVVAAATQYVYPWMYSGVIAAQPLEVVVLTARNIALIALLAVSVVRLWALAWNAEGAATVSHDTVDAVKPT